MISFFNFVLKFKTDDEELISLCDSIIEDECFPQKSTDFKDIVDHVKTKHQIPSYGIIVIRRLFVLYVKEIHALGD